MTTTDSPTGDEVVPALVAIVADSREVGWRHAAGGEVVTSRIMWRTFAAEWNDGMCDDLELVARTLEWLGPTFAHCAGELADALARSVGLPPGVAQLLGWVVDGVTTTAAAIESTAATEQQLLPAAAAIRAVGIGVCAGRAGPVDQPITDDHLHGTCFCYDAVQTGEADEWVIATLREVLEVGLAIPAGQVPGL